jgi:hypothetical protein
MHHDKTQTHVISCIFHLASSEGSEPWPIVIEDFAGNTNSVVLKPGDVLLYESAKNFHGRPTKFNGEWYTSVFVHFYPKDPEWTSHDHLFDAHYAVPPEWREIHSSTFPKVEWDGINVLEPDCPDDWCTLLNAIELEGPGEYGKVLTADGKKYSLVMKDGNNIDPEL